MTTLHSSPTVIRNERSPCSGGSWSQPIWTHGSTAQHNMACAKPRAHMGLLATGTQRATEDA
jgi:hypothetical protein